MSDDQPPSHSTKKYSARPVSPFGGIPHGYPTLPCQARKKASRILYKHTKCGGVTKMPDDMAETVEADPGFYSDLYCSQCRDYYPCGEDGEFVWLSNQGMKVGSLP